MLSSALRGLPWSAHAVVGVAMVAGLVIWLVGGAALRIGFALAGVAVGGVLGYAVGPAFGLTVSPLVPAGVGAGAGLLFGMLAFRLSVSFSLSAMFAGLAPIAAGWLIAQFGSPLAHLDEQDNPFEDITATGGLSGGEHFLPGVPIEPSIGMTDPWGTPPWNEGERTDTPGGTDAGSGHLDEAEGPPSEAEETVREAGERVRIFLVRLGDELRAGWDALPPRDRALVVLTAIAGWGVGLALGFVVPRKAAKLASAGTGALIWLPTAVWFVALVAGEAPHWLPGSAVAWVGVWAAASALGAAIQLMPWRKAADKPED